jgi:hydroxymethylbilane synthase
MQLRIGTRSSALARWQADWVAAQLKALAVDVELVHITTRGDQQQEPIGAASSPGLFTKEIQRALLDGRIDVAVHSLKDLPTDVPPGLCLAAIPPRASVADAMVAPTWGDWSKLPRGARVATGSLRRRAQLLYARCDLVMCDIRGNIDTRLRKIEEGQFDAVILAEAGLRRLGLDRQITQILPMSLLLPAVGQGALGIEARADDQAARQCLEALDHTPSRVGVTAERALLAALHGGCLAPIAGWGRIEAERLVLTGRVLSSDGSRRLEATLSDVPAESESLGRKVAAVLAEAGAEEFIQAAREL